MLLGKLPFFKDDQEEFEEAIIKNQVKFRQKQIINDETVYPPTISESAKELIKAMLNKKYKNRISIFEILNHPWLVMDEEDLEKEIEEAKKQNEPEEEDPKPSYNFDEETKSPDTNTETGGKTLNPSSSKKKAVKRAGSKAKKKKVKKTKKS